MFFNFGNSSADEARLRRIERKLDLIIRQLGIEDEAETSLPIEIRTLADEGRKIEAIKAHRDHFGSSLLEAKQAVEAYTRG